MSLPETAEELLLLATPEQWLEHALNNQTLLLIDHANCEKKAASTALSLMYRYVQFPDLLHKMSRLAREELRHFEQVLAIIQARSIEYVQLTASRYAGALHKLCDKNEPNRLVDTLLIGALIEARSYERFKALAPLLDDELRLFYSSLLKSEKRHFQDYILLAKECSGLNDTEILERLSPLAEKEASLICDPDSTFRFHSGLPVLS